MPAHLCLTGRLRDYDGPPRLAVASRPGDPALRAVLTEIGSKDAGPHPG